MSFGSRQSKEHSYLQIPLLESAASSRMITGVVPATTPPTLKLRIIECNVLKKKWCE